MIKVLIATPSYDGRLDAWYTNSLINTVVLGLQNEIAFQPVFMSYDALIQRSRNDLLEIAFSNDFDHILWIDSDIEWNPEWAVKLILSDKDVIGGTYPKKSLEEQYTVKSEIKDFVENDEGLVSVSSLGTGFLKVSKKAFTYLWDISQPYIHNGKENRWVFEVKVQDNDIISEDGLMCQKLKEGGFEIFLDISMTCNHIGTLKYQGNFKAFIDKLKIS